MADEQPHLESRVAKIELHVAHLDSTVSVIQTRRQIRGPARKETADGFTEARKNLRTDLGLFFAGFSLLLSAGLGVAALIFKG